MLYFQFEKKRKMEEKMIRKRKIKFLPDDSGSLVKRVRDALSKKNGIFGVQIHTEGSSIAVEYELGKVNFEEIEKLLLDSGISLSMGFLDRLKRGWTKFAERNELDSYAAKPTSCCHDPKIGSSHGGKK
jgi:hypothetical protein